MKKGATVFVLCDQRGGPEDPLLSFFGKKEPTPTGIAGILKHAPAPIYFAYCQKQQDGYHAHFSQLFEGPPSSPEALMHKYLAKVENVIQKQPGDYLWSHRRWRW